ncbi:TonB-dependent receptor [Neolewinella lacunae]|uniref:TonB-dependent receptor n=1 Tax=Neolewinella lacunae TaxID=1517758 RepID=A0A923T9G0_9BACT|nr:TonB-dependent receptor [Neolewinella lacunae]MBC6995023.1 TonB-dependent receptor [Neolewinella lacunae]MDN3633206.1 TonB-dependent receptor [Neolewinella lacunae]
MPKKLLLLATNLLLSAWVMAQFSVSGTVTGSGEPLIGVSVLVVGTGSGTVTDIDGKYRITVEPGQDSLEFSYLGYQTQRIAIGSAREIDVVMTEASAVLQEVVVVGYGIQKKSDLTGAVSVVSTEELVDIPTQSLGQALQGKVSGLQIIPTSGTPGADAIFRIRGVGTLNNADPLFVVDGMILNDISFLNPRDVASVSVLKDASATAIYGARGANGVIIVTTKQGSGAGQITVSAYTGYQQVVKTIDLLNATQYATLINEADVNEGRQPRYANPEQFGTGTNWQDEIFRTAPIQNVQVGFSGGNEKSSFNLSANYFRQEGIIVGSEFDRFTTRINTTRAVKDWLQIGSNLSLVLSTSQNVNAGGILLDAYRADPITVPRDSLGNFGNTAIRGNTGNPLATIEFNDNKSQDYRAVGNVFAQAQLWKGLSFRTSFGLDFVYFRSRSFSPVFEVSANQRNEESDLNVLNTYRRNWLWENTLNYNQEFGRHRVDGVVGITSQDNFGEFLSGGRTRLIGEDPSFFYLNSGDPLTSTNGSGPSGGDWGLVSYLGRVNYSFDERYLLTVSGRVDGSSRFGENFRYGFFPSVGLGWNVSQEDFWNDGGIVSRLKLRASWGQTGNDRIPEYAYTPSVTSGVNTVFGPNEILLPGATVTSLANPDLRWEETTQTDLGVELGLFENKLLLEADVYRKVTDGVLFNAPIPDYIGAGASIRNIAAVLNRGLDMQLTWRQRGRAFSYSLGGNLSLVKNEVLQLDGSMADFFSGGLGIGGQLGTNSRAGFTAGSFWGYEIDGVFQNQEELTQFPTLGTQRPGDLRFRDQNGDGVITAAGDRVVLGSAIPDAILGLNGSLEVAGFDLSFDFTGQFGNEVINAKKMARFGAYNYETSFLDRWTGEGTSNTEPRITLAGQNIETLSTRFIEDGSYIRLRNLSLGYTLPESIASRLRLRSCRLYVSGTNLWTSQEYSGYNPEIFNGLVFDAGIDRGGIYPIAKTVNFGLDLQF